MFDFANSQNQQRRPTKSVFASWAISFIAHALLLTLLIEYPQLLRGGRYHRFRPLAALANLFDSHTEKEEDKDWRTVAVLRTPMEQPSAETLKKLMKDWSRKSSEIPPIRLRWGDEQKKALANLPPMPRVKQDPKPQIVLPPPNDIIGAGSVTGNSPQNSSGNSSAAQVDPNAGKKGAANLPPSASPAKTETASNNPPTSIPDGIKPPANIAQPSNESVKVFEDEKKALKAPGSGFFDAGGFPLGDYANLIKERIKGKWFIPSHLKNSQGHTTVVFYISKDGRYSNARVESSLSSGNAALDLAALKAIIDSNPFPPLPKGFPGDRLGAKFVLSYNEP